MKPTVSKLIVGTQKMRGKLGVSKTLRKVKAYHLKKSHRLLFVARISSDTGGGVHEARICFDGIKLKEAKPALKIKPVKDGQAARLVSFPVRDRSPVQVSCTCSDYRFTWFPVLDAMDGHYGEKPDGFKVKGTGKPRNPNKIAGICPHLRSMVLYLTKIGAFKPQ